MAATGYSLVISATDRATAPIRAVNRELTNLRAPITRTTEALKGLGQASGLTAALRGLSALSPAMGALGAAASIAGIVSATSKWAEYTQELGVTARRAGMTAGALAQMEGAVRLAGGSAEGAAGGMVALKDKIFDIRGGRGGDVLGFLDRFGIGIDGIVKGSETAENMLPKLAAGLRRVQDPTARFRIAEQFFGRGADDILKLIDAGPGKIDEYLKKAKEAGGDNQGKTAAAIEYVRAQTELALAAEGLGNSVLAKFVAGGLTGLMDEVSHGIEGMTKLVDGWQPPAWFNVIFGGADLPNLAWRVLNSLVHMAESDMLGDVGGDATARALSDDNDAIARMQGGGAPPGRTIGQRLGDWWGGISGGQEDVARGIVNRMVGAHHWTREQAVGLVANLDRESEFNPTRVDDGGKAYGIAQWHPDRQAVFARWAGHDIRQSTREEQLDFIDYELHQGQDRQNREAGHLLDWTHTPQQAAGIISRFYERPGDVWGESNRRAGTAGRWDERIGKVDVAVTIAGAPAGTTATASASGAATVGAPRVDHAGVGR